MSKAFAIVAVLATALYPGGGTAYDLATREPFAPGLDSRSGDGWTNWAGDGALLQLILGVDTGASGRTASVSPSVNIGLLYLSAVAGSVAFVGSGVGYYRALSRASGSTLVGGGSAELLLTPRLVTVPLALKLALGRRLFVAAEPALVIGWVSAALKQSNGSMLDISSSPGVGAQIGAGLDANLTDRLGLSLRAGFRALRPSLKVTPLARAGEPVAQSESVDVDLTGAFWSAGLVIQL